MLVRRVRRALPPLLAAALALSLAACTSDTEDAPPPPVTRTATAIATPAAPPTPSPTPEATSPPTRTATPSPAPTETPSPTPTPAPTAAPSPTATPSPTPTATPPPLITAEDLGIRELDTAEALAAAGLTYVRYAAGEEAPWDPGLFLLDVATGEVEGWVRSLAALSEEERSEARRASDDLDVSPSNRFVSWAAHGVLHDRHTGRTYALDRDGIAFDQWWGTGPGERLLFRLVSSGAFVAMDAELRPVARLELPPGERFTSPDGGYILVRECVECELGDRFHLVNLEDEANPTIHSWTLPWKTVRHHKTGDTGYETQLLDQIIALVATANPGSCRVIRYDLRGIPRSDVTIPCWDPWPANWGGGGLPRVSPDGRLVASATSGYRAEFDYGNWPVIGAVSVFDAITGDSIVRARSVSAPWFEGELTNAWLADSSGIIVGTRSGPRIVTIDGAWEQAAGRPAPDDPDRLLAYGSPLIETAPVVMNQEGAVQASLSFGPPSAPIPEPRYQAALILRDSAAWGAGSDTLRVWTSFSHAQELGSGYAPPPLEPVVEQPPFDDRFLIEVVVDTCLNLREEPSFAAPILACLPNGAVTEVAETDDYTSGRWASRRWLHLRTDDGLEGWASAEFLRWHSGGVRLEETTGPFTTVAVGGHYDACALTEAGKAVCWNANDSRLTATLPGRYIAIDAAEGTTCAVKEDGEAVCWGSDESASDAPPGPYTAISTTTGYTCGLRESGEVVCWGSHSARARERQAREGEVRENWPWGWMPDPPAGPYVAVTVGYSDFLDASVLSACAARASGGFTCWTSSGKYDPLGPGETWQLDGDPARPLVGGDFCSVNGTGSPTCDGYEGRFTAFSRAGDNACAITPDGGARCWVTGFDALMTGQLNVWRPPDPAPARYLSISTDGSYACALSDAGDVACWAPERNVVAPPDPPPGRYVAVSDGVDHTCALTEAGEIVCWGWNNESQIDAPPGRYTAISVGEYSECALTVAGEVVCRYPPYPGARDVRHIAVSRGHFQTCALTESGEAVCWGGPERAQPPPGRYTAITVGENHSCALTETGEAVCWGQYRIADPPVGRYTAIGAGGARTCALTEGGEAACWRNDDGALTSDTPDGQYTALSVGPNHACALTDTGEAVCWSWRYIRDKSSPANGYLEELAQPPPGRYTAISSGTYRACALTEAGEVVCWGDVGYTTEPRPRQDVLP